jgi:hypothetical protein
MAILLHIGYHKTGTTWLQKDFFSKHNDIMVPFDATEICENFVYPNALRFNARSVQVRFRDRLRRVEESGRLVVLSAERLCGAPFSGGYDSAEIARRLKAVFPDAKIWISVRSQVPIISATYRNYVTSDGTATLETFLRGEPSERYPAFSLHHFEYHRLIQYYQELFGQEKVHVSMYEDFRDDPKEFLLAANKFIGFECDLSVFATGRVRYKGRTDQSTLIRRYLSAFATSPTILKYPVIGLSTGKAANQFCGLLDKLIYRHFPREIIGSRVKAIVGDFFAESNQVLAEMLKRDLSEKGYQLPDSSRGGRNKGGP